MERCVHTLQKFLVVCLFIAASLPFDQPLLAQTATNASPGQLGKAFAAKVLEKDRPLSSTSTLRLPIGLQKAYCATGHYTVSADGIGSVSSSMSIRVNKPNAQATVQKAILISSATFGSITNGCVTLEGVPVNWEGSAAVSAFSNYWADVTSIVATSINDFPEGISTLTLTECNTSVIDGEALVVVFNDATAAEKTIIIMCGAMNPAGDHFFVTLAQPMDSSRPGELSDMGLGIGYSFQRKGPGQQSQVSVNGQRLTSSAGGADDGASTNGALITVGGIGDVDANPVNPNAIPLNPRSDDELYDLLPFSTGTKLTIQTFNPTEDDNIFLAYFALSGAAIIGEGIVASQANTSGYVEASHTVKTAVVNVFGEPVSNRTVTFTITSGPNAGSTYTTTTDSSGAAFYTYTGNGGMGTDYIQACFTNSQTQQSCSNTLAFQWITPTISTGPLAQVSYCAGTTLQVPYAVTGTYNAGNLFTVQLSDTLGNFTNAATIGSMTAMESGAIHATIPANTPAGMGYRIRVVASDPAVTGSDNGNAITINGLPGITVAAAPAVCAGTTNALLNYGNPSQSPFAYNIDFDDSANTAGFVDVAFSVLADSAISLAVPGNATAATYKATVTVINANGCNSEAYPFALTIRPLPSAGIVSGITAICEGATTTLSSTASGGSWSSSNTQVATVNATTGMVTGVASGEATITYAVTTAGCSTTAMNAIAVNGLPVITSSVDTLPTVQYSDPINPVTITATDDDSGTALVLGVQWKLSTASKWNNGLPPYMYATETSTATNSRSWSLSGKAGVAPNLAPGTYSIRVAISDGSCSSYKDLTLTVTKEYADITFTAPEYLVLPSDTATSIRLSLRATVKDRFAGADADAGRISNARVTFRRDDPVNGAILGVANRPVSLVTDSTVGVASTSFTYTLSAEEQAAGGAVMNIYAVVDHCYTGYTADPVTVTIARPGMNVVTGGGHIINSASKGRLAGTAGLKTNFGFTMQNTRDSVNREGQCVIIVRSRGRIYRIQGNGVDSLLSNTSDSGTRVYFVMKAHYTDITNPYHSKPGPDNLSLAMRINDVSARGQGDQVSILLQDPATAEVIFSSNWNGSTTTLQPLGSGNVQARTDTTRPNAPFASTQTEADLVVSLGQLKVTVLPNPSTHYFTLVAQSRSANMLQIHILNATGKVVETKTNVAANSTTIIGHTYRPGLYYVEIVQGNERVTMRLVKLAE